MGRLDEVAAHPPFQRGGMGDHTAGQSLAGGIAAALFHRERTGKGQLVMTSLLRQGLYTISFDLSVAVRYGIGMAVANRAKMGNPCINNYCDRDGKWFWIVGLEGERHWPPLARAVGHPEWIDDPRFSTPQGRAANAAELINELDRIFATRSRDDWGKIFDAEHDMWWAPVQSVDEVMADPQVHAAGGFYETLVHPVVGMHPVCAPPFRFASVERWLHSHAPTLGEHNREILGGLLGLSDPEIDELAAAGVIGTRPTGL